MKTIIWDVDDVLNNLMKEWFEGFWLKSHPDCNLNYNDLIENPPYKLLQTNISDYRKSLDEFRSTRGSDFKPVPEVYEWFQINGSKYRHIALTAVPITLAQISASWVYIHFGKWIRTFSIVPSPRDNDPDFSYERNKKEFLQWFGKGDILVDDNMVNIEGAKSLGMQVIVFPRPWNNSNDNLNDIP